MFRFQRFLCSSLLLVLLTSCALLQSNQVAQPTVIIVSPPSGTTFQAGQLITVQSTSADPKGITRVELLVDGTILRTDASPDGQPQAQLTLAQTWTAAGPGSHLVVVRATNPAGASGQAALNVSVQAQTSQNINPTPTVPVSTQPAPPSIATSAPTNSNIPPPPPPQPAATSIRTSTVAPPPSTPSVTPSPSIPNWPLVRQGEQGPIVFAIQYLLKFYGHNLTVDGSFGPATRSAVITFQTSKGLAADGIVGPNTWSALIQGATIRLNSTGDDVRAVQHLLKTKFGHDLNVDGIFGPKTESAVKEFQSAHHLAADGIVGPLTWQSLVAIQ